MSDWFEGESPGTSDSRTLRTGRGEAVAHSGSARDMRRAHDTESHAHRVCIITVPTQESRLWRRTHDRKPTYDARLLHTDIKGPHQADKTCWVWRSSSSVTESSDSDTPSPDRMLEFHTGLSKDAPWEARTATLR